ncbi:MAG TPA: response regulator [Thermoanaerobaculia bacterium]|jgi:diguanylate cyclase (GGDEF)-like protein
MTSELESLRIRFRTSTAARLAEMQALVEALTCDAGDRASLDALARHFHGLAGLGTTYGYPSISTLADEGEAIAVPLSRRGGMPEAALIERWRELIAAIGAELARVEGQRDDDPAENEPASTFRVLLVEDDREIAEYLLPILRGQGFICDHVATRADAFEALADRLPDALVCDLVLPDGTGYDVVEALREMPGGDGKGAIVISSHDAFGDRMRAIQVGADAFEGKPLDVEALVRRLRVFQERKEQTPERILAVEDDPVQAVIIRRILESAGYEIEICSDPARFDDVMTSFGPDLLLMDVRLPGGVSGFDLVRYVRQDERFGTLPIIFVTGEQEQDAIVRGIRSGGDDYLPKPVDPSRLLSSVASRLERARAMRSLTDRDPLTGLLTRSALHARARQISDGALLLIDVDHFKEVNDAYGHAAGDRVLATLGALLRRGLRQTDLAARVGGEEFVVVVEHASAEEGIALAGRLLGEFAAIDHGGFQVTFSAGVARMTGPIDAALAAADAAMYEAKRAGRNRVAPALW